MITKGREGSIARRAVVYLGLIAAVVVVGAYGLDYVVHPWAHSYPGHKALVGYWQGEMVFGRGDSRKVALQLIKNTADAGGGVTGYTPFDIEGTAKTCGPQGTIVYDVLGKSDNRHGSSFEIGFDPKSQAPGKHPDVTRATWDGDDMLELETRAITIDASGASEATGSIDARPGRTEPGASDPGVIRFEMRRSTEASFDEACS